MEGVSRELEGLDFGFGPGNLGPPANVDQQGAGNLVDLNFDFGAFPNDPFSEPSLGATGSEGLADFDLSKLDANFFEKLDAIEVSDQQQGLNKQDFDQFWSSMDTSVPKF